MKKKIVMATFGSLGDLHPYIALSTELTRRGHRAVIATSDLYQQKVEAEGIEFALVRPGKAEFGEDETAWMREVMDARKGPETVIKKMLMPHLRASYEDLMAAAQGADILVTHPITFAGPVVAEKLKLNWVSSILSPISIFSAYDPPILPPAPGMRHLRGIGPLLFGPLLRLAKKMVRPWTVPVLTLRKEIGLPPSTLDPIFEGQFSPHLNLALFSSVLAEPQKDWPPNTLVTGFPFYDRQEKEQGIPSELAAFLDAGSPPIVFTLGSSAVMDAGTFYAESAKAAQQLNRRAVLLIGRDPRNKPNTPLPEGIAAFEYAPYSELFPRAAAIVHQGGVGTTAQALRSGRPMLVMPYSHDQPDNAYRVERLGVGRVISRNRYTAAAAAAELKPLLTVPSYTTRAAEIGKRVQQEDGTRTACDALEFC